MSPVGKESVESGPTVIISILSEEAGDPYEVIGSSVMVTQLIWHPHHGGDVHQPADLHTEY